MVNASAALRTLGGIAMKIANDVRLYASGPRAGFGEITIPDNEPGSSIMPGKINPTQSEALTMVAVQVFGNDTAVAFAGTQGHFQLNVYKPVILHNMLESIELLADGLRSFDERCARGIEPNRERIRRNVDESLMLVTALNPHIGYENSAQIALKAHRDGTSLREAALALGLVSAAGLRQVDRPGGHDAAGRRMTRAAQIALLFAAVDVYAQAQQSPTPSAVDAPVNVVEVASGLDHPWGLAFLPDGSMLVTERSGQLLRIARRRQDAARGGRRAGGSDGGPGEACSTSRCRRPSIAIASCT